MSDGKFISVIPLGVSMVNIKQKPKVFSATMFTLTHCNSGTLPLV